MSDYFEVSWIGWENYRKVCLTRSKLHRNSFLLNSIPPWWCRWYVFKKRSQAGGAITSHTPAVCRSHCFPFSCGFVKKFPHTLEEFVCLGNWNRLDYLEIGGKNSMFPFRLSSRVQTSYKYVVCVTMYGPRIHLWEIFGILPWKG